MSSPRGISILHPKSAFSCVLLPIVMIMLVTLQFVRFVRWSIKGKVVPKSRAQRSQKIHVATNSATSTWRRNHTGLVGTILMGLIGRPDLRDASAAGRNLLGTINRVIVLDYCFAFGARFNCFSWLENYTAGY